MFMLKYWKEILVGLVLLTMFLILWTTVLKRLFKEWLVARKARYQQNVSATQQGHEEVVGESAVRHFFGLLMVGLFIGATTLAAVGIVGLRTAQKQDDILDALLGKKGIKADIAKLEEAISRLDFALKQATQEQGEDESDDSDRQTSGLAEEPAFNCGACTVNTEDAASKKDNVWTGVRCTGSKECEDECIVDCSGTGDLPTCGKCYKPK